MILERKSGFTLIEMLIVIAVIAVLSVVVVLVLNPAELLRMSRDSNRLQDLAKINRSLSLAEVDQGNSYFGSSSVIYVSIPDSDPGCANLNLPVIGGWTYACKPSSTYRKVDGTGWIPVNFQRLSFREPLPILPVDPINTSSSGLYYTYAKGSWELTAVLESNRYESSATGDGGNEVSVFEIGNNLEVSPIYRGVSQSTSTITVSSILPSSGYNSGLVSITNILGQGFSTSSITVKLTKSGQSDIIGSGFTFVNSSTLSGGTFNLSSAATGTWNVYVGSGSNSSTLTNGFTINTSLSLGLAAAYSFDEGLGTSVTDASPNGNNGTFSGSPQWQSGTNCKYSNCLRFPPGSNYVSVPNAPSLNIQDNLSISFWIKMNAASSAGASYFPIRKYTSTAQANFILYYCGNSCGSTNRFQWFANASGWKSLGSSTPTIATGTWNHIGFVYTSSTGGQLYWNGSPYGGTNGSGLLATSSNPLNIGITGGTVTEWNIDDVKIYNRALSPSEMTAAMNTPL